MTDIAVVAECLAKDHAGRPRAKLPIPEIVAAYSGTPNQRGPSFKELAAKHEVGAETIRRPLIEERVPITSRGKRRRPV